MRVSLALALAAGLLTGAGAQAAGPEAIVEALYAGHPHAVLPPGGVEIWSEDMRVAWRAFGERGAAGAGLSFDFMTASQDEALRGYDVETLSETAGEAEVRVTLENAWGPVVLLYTLVQEDGWVIAEVRRADGDGGWRLSDLISQSR